MLIVENTTEKCKKFPKEKKTTKKIETNISSVTLLKTRNILRFLFDDGDDCDSSVLMVIVSLSAGDAEALTFNGLDTIDLCYEMGVINDSLDGIGSIYCVTKSGAAASSTLCFIFILSFIVWIVKTFWHRLNENNENDQVSQLTMKYMEEADDPTRVAIESIDGENMVDINTIGSDYIIALE